MAMLAEPRQRKRYNLVPKGKALYEGGLISLITVSDETIRLLFLR